MNDPREMLAAYFEGKLNADQVAEFEAWLREDQQRCHELVREAMLDCHLAEILHEQNVEHVAADLSDDSHFGELLLALEPPKDAVEVVDITEQVIRKKAEALLQRDLLAQQHPTDTEKNPSRMELVIHRSLVYAGIAAALFLAVALLWPAAQPPHTPDTLTSEVPDERVMDVAVVTSQSDARWRAGNFPVDIPTGSTLLPWQRLTLVSGYAQITTGRGAIAVLQAPCTIEMTQSDNALRLHSGKMVGRCLTEKSKGFVVHAPGVDVVDLGTEFGVEVDSQGGSTVLVMDGSVRAQPTPQSPQAFKPVVLHKSQARRVVPETGSLEMIAVSEAPLFHRKRPHPYVEAVLDAAPVAYWRFEDDANRTIANEVASGRSDLKVVGPAQLTDKGVIGKAGRLHNRRQPYAYFETAEPLESLNGLDEYTIELWYYTDERYEVLRDNSVGSVFNLYDPNQGIDDKSATEAWLVSLELTNDFWIDQPNTQKMTRPPGWREYSLRVVPMTDLDTKERREVYTAQDYAVGRWQHVVLVKTAGGVKLYLDGELAEDAAYTPPTINVASVRLGRSVLDVLQTLDSNSPYTEGQYRPLRGRVDEVALYDKPLTAEQIAEHNALAKQREDKP